VSRTITSLIPQGPDDDGGVVLVSLQHAHPSIHDAVQPEGVGGRHYGVVVQGGVEPMGLEIGLIHQVDAQLTAQLVPMQKKAVVPVSKLDLMCFSMSSEEFHLGGSLSVVLQ
jgi:hypothetical protein